MSQNDLEMLQDELETVNDLPENPEPEDSDDNKIKIKSRFWLFSHSSENFTSKQKAVYPPMWRPAETPFTSSSVT